MLSPASKKRLKHHRDELASLKNACCMAPAAEVAAAYCRYHLRLEQIKAGWRNDMERRADTLKEDREGHTPRVWELADNIREVMGGEYGNMAAEIAVSVLAPLQRQKKPLSMCNGK